MSSVTAPGYHRHPAARPGLVRTDAFRFADETLESTVCAICDGASSDEYRFTVHRCVLRYGWFVQAVECGGDQPDWAYTVGLSAGFDHPELVVVGLPTAEAGALLNSLAEGVRAAGEVFAPGETIGMADGRVAQVLDVHPQQFAWGVLATWSDYYGSLGPPYPRAEAVQIWLPDVTPVRLDRPHDILGSSCGNRQTRRRRLRQTRNRQRRRHWQGDGPR